MTFIYPIISVQFSSLVQLCPTLCDPMDYNTPGFSVHHQLLEFAQTQIHWVSYTLGVIYIEAIPTISSSIVPFSSCLQSFLASGSFPISQFFASGGKIIAVSASASALSSNEYSGLISFRMDWFGLLAIQGILKSLLQHHNSKASVIWCLAFFMVQFSHSYMITGKTIVLTIQTFVSKVMSLLFNMLSRFVITFLPRSKHPLIS